MPQFFISRPIVAMVIAIITVIAGLVTMQGLPLAQFPDIVPPQIILSTTYTGADAKTIEDSVATPLEQQMNGVAKMLYMQSVNDNDGSFQELITFDIDSSPDIDEVNVQNRLAQAQPYLPPQVNQYGMNFRTVTGFPLIIISLYSPKKTYDSLFMANYANINLIDTLFRLNGVGDVRVFGAGNYAMRVWLKPNLLAKLGITATDVISAVQQQNTVNPAGQFGAEPALPNEPMTASILTQGRLATEKEFGNIVLRANPDGSFVRLKDVARIELGALTYTETSRWNGQSSCSIGIFQAPGSNSMKISEAVRKTMEQLKQRFPDELDYKISLDATLAVKEGLQEITKTLLWAVLLVTLVVFIFLQNWRATIIPMIAVPVSLIGAFIFFPIFGFSINTLSLFGFVLAIGLVVDDAIIVVEAIERHIEEGQTPKEASLAAMQEVSGPVVAIALALVSVFVPMAFMGGIQGRLNRQFAVTIAMAVIISAFNALSLSPALSSLILKARKESKGRLGRVYGGFNRQFQKGRDNYQALSRALINKAAVAVIILSVFFLLDIVLGARLPIGFVPQEDFGFIFINVQLPVGASLQRTQQVCNKIEKILGATDGVQYYTAIAGFNLQNRVTATYNGFFFVALKPWDQRKSRPSQMQAMIDILNKKFHEEVPEAIALAAAPPSIPGLGTSGGFSFWIQDRSGASSYDKLAGVLQKFLAACHHEAAIGKIFSPFSNSVPQFYMDVDRDKVLKQGVAIQDVYQTLQAYLGSVFINQFNRFNKQWDVFLSSESNNRVAPKNISQFYVRNKNGQMVPLSAFIKTRRVLGPEFTNHFNLFPSIEILGSSAPGYSSGQTLDALERVAKKALPDQMSYDYSDVSYQEKNAAASPGPVFALSITVVFLILAALYESWSLPFSVLLSVPIAVSGAFAGLFLRHFAMNVFAQIGLIMLIGLSAKNAILIVEFAKIQHEKGRDYMEAALEGAKLRLRPILMTSFAFILGCMPLWFAGGSGAVGRQILGTVVIAGMLAATMIAIFIIPSLYVMVEKISHRGSKKRIG